MNDLRRQPVTENRRHASDLGLSGMDAGSYPEVGSLQRRSDGKGALDGPAGAVEGRNEPVDHSVDLTPVESPDLCEHKPVVAVEEVPPALVPKVRGGWLPNVTTVN